MRAARYIPSEERLVEVQPECKTLLRFAALTMTEHEAVMDLDNECCPIGGRVR